MTTQQPPADGLEQEKMRLSLEAGQMRRNRVKPDLVFHTLRSMNDKSDFRVSDDFLLELASGKSYISKMRPAPRADYGPVLWAGELLDKELPAIEWIVPDLLPAGVLGVVAGKPKIGKSWLCLQLGIAVASGGKFLGRDCKKGKVIYLALEDGERNLQDRLKQQGAENGERPEILGFLMRFDPLNEPLGMQQFISLLAIEKPLLVIIDTLASAKNRKVKEDDAGDTADLLNPLRNLAQESGCAIIFVLHHGKSLYGDVVLDVRGSSAIGAAADMTWGLYRERGKQRAKLSSVGRNVLDLELAMDFDKTTCCWQVVGEAEEVTEKENVQAILDVLRVAKEADIEQLAAFTELTPRAVSWALQGLLNAEPPLAAYREAATTAKGMKKRVYFLPPAESVPSLETVL